MKSRMTLTLSLSALMLGGTMVGCTAGGGQGIASASDKSVAIARKHAAKDAAKAQKALARHDGARAVTLAEAAVQGAPRDAQYRMILAQSYLAAGRFVSARQAFSDVLDLAPDNQALAGKAALNLALAETATGDWAAARDTLTKHGSDIPVGDLGLAMALAGNPNGAVAVLTQAVRSPGADAKLRQNLALSFALAGNWQAARATASVDMSPADVNNRLEQWAQFAQPAHAADQVATLLGVTPTQDQGQPQALALNANVPMSTPVAPPVAVAAAEPTPDATDADVKVAAADPAPVETIRPEPGATKVMIAETAAAKPVAAAPVKAVARKVAAAPASAPAPSFTKGDWYVQFGAYENAAVARDGWTRLRRRYAALGALDPNGMNYETKAGSFYRLSVGGFARGDADRLCRSVRAKGGNCFVRKDAGDRIAKWVAPRNTQVASR